MHRSLRYGFPLLFLFMGAVALTAQTKTAEQPQTDKTAKTIRAVVESSLKTQGKQIRQFAFDGDAGSYFASENNPTKTDQFTLTFDQPVAVKSVAVTTGNPKGGDTLEVGVLEFSEDGKKFETLTKFTDGKASAKPEGKKIAALRVTPTEDMKHPLAIREFVVDSEPKVLTFKYPVEYVVDVSEAPDMKEWAEKAANTCERHYAMICEELWSDGLKPPTVIKLSMTGYNGVAFASGGNITGSAKYFKSHQDDLGAMIHETCHCVQMYRGRRTPGWLVEGIPDYVRFFKYEADSRATAQLRKLKPESAKYDASYRTTAAFLNFVSEKYDKEFVRKLNAVIREGKYTADTWKDLTGKTVEELSQEWKRALAG